LAPTGRLGRERFWTSGNPQAIRPLMSRLWQADIWLERFEEATARGAALDYPNLTLAQA
jgi:hypothetical protein